MRLKSILLENYIGIKNGLKEDDIYIDFSKCKHKLLLIIGDNGSGKSTLNGAINPLPESNDNFIPKKPARKIIEYFNNDNSIWKIEYVHNIKPNGDRDNTKGYITEIDFNGSITELNPSGNITSCKDMVCNKYKLDYNFITLTQLSSADRGIADKKPAERKKFVNVIVAGLEVYNDINKTITKRSSIFKSMINTLAVKIGSIGNKESLEASLTSIQNRINLLMNEKDSLISIIATAKSTIKLLDPEFKIQSEYDQILQALSSIQTEFDNCKNQINMLLNVLNMVDIGDIKSIHNTLKVNMSNIETKVQVMESNVNIMMINRDEEYKQLLLKINRLNSLTSETNFKEIKDNINLYKNNITKYEQIFLQIGIDTNNMVTKDEYIVGLNTLKEIKETIDTFKSFTDYDILQKVAYEYIPNQYYPDIDLMNKNINTTVGSINDLKLEYIRYETLNSVSDKLKLRPSNCKIDNCQFIKDAISANDTNPIDNLNKISIMMDNGNSLLNKQKIELEEAITISKYINYIKTLHRNINSYSYILKKLPYGNILGDINEFTKKIVDGYKFDEINQIYACIDYANIFEEYKIAKDILYKLEVDFKLYESKASIIDEINSDIEILNKKLDEMANEINNNTSNLSLMKRNLSDMKGLDSNYNLLEEYINKLTQITNDKESLFTRFSTIKNDMASIKVHIETVNINDKKIVDLNVALNSMMSDRDKFKHGLSLLEEYTSELEEYNLKYDKIETIRQYSSPTKKGIQLIFMELYMNKTVTIANELLSLMFEGKYKLGNFVINEDEFRIPCKGEDSLPNDDVSSMSTSEICMISMIVSFALLYQSASDYNIFKLDEIDGGLDRVNRAMFITLLLQLLDILKVDQCVMISHNNESSISDIDTIILRQSEYTDVGNVIYRHST